MKRNHEGFIVFLTLIVSLFLEILPLPYWSIYARPQFVFLFLIYWTLFNSTYVTVEVACIAGLILDLLTGTAFGAHGLVFAVVIYVLTKLRRQMQYFPKIQQSIMIFILLMLNLALSYWIHGFSGLPPKTWAYWLPGLTTIFLWPVVRWMLDRFRRTHIHYI